MEFTRQDVRRLYGNKIFRIDPGSQTEAEGKAPEPVETPLPAPPEIPLLMGKASVDWKMRPTAKMVALLYEAEFANRDLTGKMKEAIVAAGLNTDLFGFGVLRGKGPWSLADMPVKLAIACIGQAQPQPQSVTIAGKRVYSTETLSSCAEDPAALGELQTALLKIGTALGS